MHLSFDEKYKDRTEIWETHIKGEMVEMVIEGRKTESTQQDWFEKQGFESDNWNWKNVCNNQGFFSILTQPQVGQINLYCV